MRDPWLSQHTVLAGIVLGNSGILLRGTKIDKKSVWYIPMYMVSAFVFVHLAMGGNLMPELEPGLHTVPVTAFALMLLSEFSAFIFNSVIDIKFTMGYFRVPAMTVHMIALLFYCWEPQILDEGAVGVFIKKEFQKADVDDSRTLDYDEFVTW